MAQRVEVLYSTVIEALAHKLEVFHLDRLKVQVQLHFHSKLSLEMKFRTNRIKISGFLVDGYMVFSLRVLKITNTFLFG